MATDLTESENDLNESVRVDRIVDNVSNESDTPSSRSSVTLQNKQTGRVSPSAEPGRSNDQSVVAQGSTLKEQKVDLPAPSSPIKTKQQEQKTSTPLNEQNQKETRRSNPVKVPQAPDQYR